MRDAPYKARLMSVLRVGATLALGYLALLLLVYLRQAQMLYLPDLPGRALERTPASHGLAYDDVHLPTADGETLHGWFLPRNGSNATILFFHGNAGNISQRLQTLLDFHSLGYNTFIIDYRGYGESSGSPDEPGTYEDARAAWRYLVNERGIAAEHIVLFGRSLGGAIAAKLATEVAPAAVIVESSFTSIPDLAAELYPWLPARQLAIFSYDTRASLQHVKVPVLVVHSRDDEIIPYHHGERLFEAAAGEKTMLTLRGSHNVGFRSSGRHYIEGLDAFLATVTARATPAAASARQQ